MSDGKDSLDMDRYKIEYLGDDSICIYDKKKKEVALAWQIEHIVEACHAMEGLKMYIKKEW